MFQFFLLHDQKLKRINNPILFTLNKKVFLKSLIEFYKALFQTSVIVEG